MNKQKVLPRGIARLISGLALYWLSTSLMAQNTPLFRVTPDGKVGIGNGAPAYALDVVGDINLTGCIRYSGGNCVSNADAEIRPVPELLRKVERLRFVEFRMPRVSADAAADAAGDTEDAIAQRRWIGVTGQDLRLIFPELVKRNPNNQFIVDYSTLDKYILRSVVELAQDHRRKSDEVDELKSQLNALKAELRELAKRVP